MEMSIPLPVVILGVGGVLYLFYRWGHKDGHKEGWEEGYSDGYDEGFGESEKENTKSNFIEYAAINIFASRIQGLFTGKIKRNAIAKEAVLDAQALWNRMAYEEDKIGFGESQEPTDDE